MKVRALVCAFVLATVSVGAVGTMLKQTAAPPQEPEPSPHLSFSEIELYKNAQTLIEWTPRQIRDCPFLHKLRSAGSQDQLPKILDRVGQTCTDLFQNFPKVSCDEEVVSDSFPAINGPPGLQYWGPHSILRREFHYIVIPRPIGDFLGFQEYRTDLKGNPLDAASLKGLPMVTSDFAASFLYLSPADQHDNRFRHLGIQTIRKHECFVMGFAQNPARVHSATFLNFYGKSYVVLVQGLAWIDTQTFQVLRVTTWLLAPRQDIDLSSQASTVDFYPARLSESESVIWLPRDVQVEILYRGMRVCNTHHYTNFKLFRVESTIKPGG